MEDWVQRAIARWPNVPFLFGWLSLDRRGRWLIKGEIITRSQIVDTIGANYAADEYGRWYFQNGPQRGYVKLDCAPLVLSASDDGQSLIAHTGARVVKPSAAFLDEEGSILLMTEHGPGLLADSDLDWALRHLEAAAGPVNEERLASALALPSGTATALSLRIGPTRLPLVRLDADRAPAEGERWSS